MKNFDKKGIAAKITAAVCAVVLVLAAGAVLLSGMGSRSVETVAFASPSPSPVPEEPHSEQNEANAVSDEQLSLFAVPLDETGVSLMTQNFIFSYVGDPEDIVEEKLLGPGMHDERVITLKERLMEKGFMEGDEPSDYYGEQTASSVQLFQRACDLEITGTLDDTTFTMLMDENAPSYLLNVGLNGTDVEEVQKRLKKLGYLKVKVTGYFGADTEAAVKAFQKNNGLTVDGCVGSETREVLYSSSAKKAVSPSKSKSPSPSKNTATKDPAPSKTAPADPPQQSENNNSGLPAPDSGRVETFINYAQTLMGKPYVLGGKGPEKFDCSGFIYYALNKSGVMSINYMTSAGWKKSSFPTVSKSELQRGDILCFNGPNGTGHVGIYLGSQKMLDASSDEGKIRITSNIWSKNYWNKYFRFGKRALY